jgi:quercetin dioxygenase-like cupin family protein
MKRILFASLLASALQVNAQEAVAVSKEPRHKNVFENEYLRVLDVHISPGDTTLFHKHETPSVFISLHPVRTGSQVLIEDGDATVLSLDRRITYESFSKSPRIHRVWNADNSVFHVMDVEVLTKGAEKTETPVTLPEFKQLFDAPQVRTYRVTLKSNQQLEVNRKVPVLVVGLTDASNVMANNKALLKEGDFLFIPASQPIKLVNKEANEYSFALLEFK